MWAALRSDLQEFVETVKDESATVLATPKVREETDDDHGELEHHEQRNQGIIMGEDGEVFYEDDNDVAIMDEIDRLVRDEETFTEPLDTEDEDVKQFLADFSVESRTDDISKLLEENPETLQVQFEDLVPTRISYQEFWERYYFRCNGERIQRRWDLELERARKAREEAIANSIQGVKNLFGGAVKAVASTLNAADEGVDAVTGAHASSSLFGASGRPPFVMNTAVDEDEEEDEEEEELGWDDDDEDDLEDPEDAVGEDYKEGDSEVVEFSDAKDDEIERLTQQLTQATEERDQLHNTVEMQTKEIAKLQLGDAGGAAEKGHHGTEMEQLKMQLFEKDAELAALRASLEDSCNESFDATAKKNEANVAAQERELDQLHGAVEDKNRENLQLKKLMAETQLEVQRLQAENVENAAILVGLQRERDELEAKLFAATESDKALEAATAENQELQALVKTLQEQLAASKSNAESLCQAMETTNNDATSQVMAAQNEAASAKAQVEAVTQEVEELKGSLHFTEGRAEHLEHELQESKAALQKKEAEFATKLAEEVAKFHVEHEQLSSGSPNSDSTGVKVPAAAETAPPTVAGIPSTADGDEEGDDWGEDWGDDEDP